MYEEGEMRGPIMGRNPSDGSSNPYIAHYMNQNHTDENPYSDRGFMRGYAGKLGVKKYLCLSLDQASLCILMFDIVMAMIYFIQIFNDWAAYRLMQFFYFCFAAGRIYGYYRLYKKDTMARRQAWMMIHVGALIAKVIVNTFHFF